MRNNGGFVAYVKGQRAVFHDAIRNCDALVLTHVLGPGLNDTSFEVFRWRQRIVE